MKKYVIIKADYNDSDYITEESIICDEDVELIKRVASCIKQNNKSHNWDTFYSAKNPPKVMYKDILTEDEIDQFNEFVPYGEDGIHSIENIKIITVSDEEILLGWF